MKSLLCILLFFLCRMSFAQPNSVWFDEVTDEAGYSIHGVRHILQDRDGFMWFCHSDGVTKYDGYDFKFYTHKELSSRYFPDKSTALVFLDKQQNVWIVTDAGALMMYQEDLDRFQLMNDTSQIIKGTAYSFIEDENENFWIGSTGGGLYKINLKKKYFKNYRTNNSDTTTINNDYVTALAIDHNRNLWVGTTNGLCRYDTESDGFHRIKLANSNADDAFRFRVIRSLLVSSDESLYVGTYGGLHKLDLKNRTARQYLHQSTDSKSLRHNSIFKIQEDDQGIIWIATYGAGVNSFNPSTGVFNSYGAAMNERGRLHTKNLFTIYFDRQGRLWVGGADEGLFVYNPNSKKIHSIGNSAYDSSSISPGWIRNIFQENDSIIWIGFNGAGINQYNIKSGKVVRRFVNKPNDTTSLGHNAVVAIDRDQRGNLWFGLEGGGVNKLNKASGKFTRYIFKQKKNSIANNAVSALLADENLIWITTYVSGLNVFDNNSGKFYYFREDSLNNLGISFSATESILKHDGNIWFATHQGIVVFDKARKIFTKIPNTRGEITMVSKNQELELRPYTDKEILINNDLGEIVKINYNSPSDFRQEILWRDTVSAEQTREIRFAADRSRNLWISSGDLLSKIDLSKNDRSTFSVANAITNDRRLSGIFTADDGRIFLTGANGFIWFYPDEIEKDSTPLKVVLTGLEIFNRPIEIAGTDSSAGEGYYLSGHISRLRRLELFHHQNFFSIRFAALAYTQREKIQYAYQLEGFDRDWVYVGTRKFANYTNLDPGTYTFNVKATNADGYWNQDPVSIDVVILPPFWRTTWFMALSILLGASVIYTIHRYRVAQSLKVERLRNKIASDLHDEVGSSLTRISIYSDLLQNGVEAEERNNYLAGIGELSREVVSTMSDIVWSIDNRHDSFGALIIRMKDFATEALQAKNIDLNFSTRGIDENRILDPALKQNIYLIFKESIHNVIKHAHARHVEVCLANENDEFTMTISDDGRGFPQNNNGKGNGLRNMLRRAETLQGKFSIQNHNGTTLTLKLKPV